jgi:hypothetical protein
VNLYGNLGDDARDVIDQLNEGVTAPLARIVHWFGGVGSPGGTVGGRHQPIG